MGYVCSVCGAYYKERPTCWKFDHPAAVADLSDGERLQRVEPRTRSPACVTGRIAPVSSSAGPRGLASTAQADCGCGAQPPPVQALRTLIGAARSQRVAPSGQRIQLAAAGTIARLSFYPPGLRQAAHSHDATHVSIIITGSVREVSPDRDEIGSALQLNLRPYEMIHRVEFGPHGALILRVDVPHRAGQRTFRGWVHGAESAAQRTLLRLVLGDCVWRDPDTSESIEELVATIEAEPFRGAPPGWLSQARERLLESPADARITALARAAGVHRTHFARAFTHWFKASATAVRRRAMLSRAIAAIAAGEGLAAAALAAGFADQSHMCRTMNSVIGTTPQRLLRRM